MRLATPAEVLSVLGIQSGTGSLTTAGVALDATFGSIETHLETVLALRTQTDYFNFGRFEIDYPTLRLSNSLINRDELLVVADMITGRVFDSSEYFVDYERGIVTLEGSVSSGRGTVSVTYTSGYDASVSDPTLLEGIPDKLKQAHISFACAYMQFAPAAVAKDKARFVGNTSTDGYKMTGMATLEPFVRPRGTCIWAARTAVIE